MTVTNELYALWIISVKSEAFPQRRYLMILNKCIIKIHASHTITLTTIVKRVNRAFKISTFK